MKTVEKLASKWIGFHINAINKGELINNINQLRKQDLETVRSEMIEKMELFNKKHRINNYSLWGQFADIVDGDIELINEHISNINKA